MTVTVAIVGRPNVGKSTLFNRLVGRKIALVDDTPGVTRDRREADGHIADLHFKVLDTAGYEDRTDGSLEDRMRQQTEIAIRDADVILFMIDAGAGVTPLDERFAQVLRKAGKDVHLIGNKAEGKAADPGLMEAYSLGFGEPVALSAEHGQVWPTCTLSCPRPSMLLPRRPRRKRCRPSSTRCPRSMSTCPRTTARPRTEWSSAGTPTATSMSRSSAGPTPASRR